MTTNNNVRRERRHWLMTQEQLAKKAGVSVRTIVSIEKGASCQMGTKRKVLRALGRDFMDHEKVWPVDG